MKRRSILGAALAAIALPFQKLFRRKPRDIVFPVIRNADYGMSMDEIMRDVHFDMQHIYDWKARQTTDKDKLLDDKDAVCTVFKV